MGDQTRAPLNLAAAFKALGDPTRLRIYEFLCSCCCPVSLDQAGDIHRTDPPTASDVCCRVTGAEKITSTVSFHLKELRQVGLITMEKHGKHMVCGINTETLVDLRAYMNGLGEKQERDCAC